MKRIRNTKGRNTKRRNTKHKNTKRRNTKRRNTKRINTKRINTKRRNKSNKLIKGGANIHMGCNETYPICDHWSGTIWEDGMYCKNESGSWGPGQVANRCINVDLADLRRDYNDLSNVEIVYLLVNFHSYETPAIGEKKRLTLPKVNIDVPQLIIDNIIEAITRTNENIKSLNKSLLSWKDELWKLYINKYPSISWNSDDNCNSILTCILKFTVNRKGINITQRPTKSAIRNLKGYLNRGKRSPSVKGYMKESIDQILSIDGNTSEFREFWNTNVVESIRQLPDISYMLLYEVGGGVYISKPLISTFDTTLKSMKTTPKIKELIRFLNDRFLKESESEKQSTARDRASNQTGNDKQGYSIEQLYSVVNKLNESGQTDEYIRNISIEDFVETYLDIVTADALGADGDTGDLAAADATGAVGDAKRDSPAVSPVISEA